MRSITDHQINECNEKITIAASDGLTLGGAPKSYRVLCGHPAWVVDILFQDGPIAEVGTNGLTHEVLLAIVEDRLLAFQSGTYACVENGHALMRVQEAMAWLKQRTKNRLARGVEGTHSI